MADGAIIIGGTQGIGLELARTMVARGDRVTLTGRDQQRAEATAKELGSSARGIALDLTKPHSIAQSLPASDLSAMWCSAPFSAT